MKFGVTGFGECRLPLLYSSLSKHFSLSFVRRIVFTSTFTKVCAARGSGSMMDITFAQEDYAEFLADALPLHLLHVLNVKMS